MNGLRSLLEIAKEHPTDKIDHGFVDVYDKAFSGRRGSVRRMLEIGVHEGSSLLMWASYFPGVYVTGWDLRSYPEGAFGERVTTQVVDQGSRLSILEGIANMGSPLLDLIIDDGSHRMRDQQESLCSLWPFLAPGGTYIIEDLHTSLPNCPYEWAGGGCRDDFSNSSLRMLERLRDGEGLSSVYLGPMECEGIERSCDSCVIYDVRGDGRHITSILRKKSLARPASLAEAL